MKKLLQILCAACVVVLALIPQLSAQQLYATNEFGKELYLVNYPASSVTTIATTTEKPDDIIIIPNGNLIYTQNPGNGIEMYNPTTSITTQVATIAGGSRDLVLEPGGNSILIANYGGGKIIRMNLSTFALTTLISKLVTVNGLAYDASGNLFAVAHSNTIIQVDPVAGTILNTLVLEPSYKANGGDGMTYDPYTGQLWVSHIGTQGNGLIEVPTNLSGFQLFQTGKILAPDGIVSDGNGNLYIGAAYKEVYEYNIPSNTLTKKVLVSGVDSIALIPGTY
jgi:streptogramin lyase